MKNQKPLPTPHNTQVFVEFSGKTKVWSGKLVVYGLTDLTQFKADGPTLAVVCRKLIGSLQAHLKERAEASRRWSAVARRRLRAEG